MIVAEEKSVRSQNARGCGQNIVDCKSRCVYPAIPAPWSADCGSHIRESQEDKKTGMISACGFLQVCVCVYVCHMPG